jgi:uncharacterized protein (TIGR02118 family)
MIKVSVMYSNRPGARFDHEYYRDKHMPLVKSRMGDSCKYYTVDKGLAGGAPGSPATYVGMCHIFCESVDAFQAGFGPHANEIMADIPNYTDLKSRNSDQRGRRRVNPNQSLPISIDQSSPESILCAAA